jgi:hypothetical protein
MNGRASNRTFVKVILVILVVLAGVGLLIRTASTGRHRPEGVAERWLAAVADTGRRGVSADARRRAEHIGPVVIAAPLLPINPDPLGSAARVPFRLHQRLRHGSGPLRQGTLILRQTSGSWHVLALDSRRPGELVRSEGGSPSSRAPLGLWLGAFGLGIILAVIAHLIVRWADRSARSALTGPAGAPVP